ncbi:MAG: ABC transporter permease [Bdellovibrionaceae bacterium]|nr:ABC transporter permease [Pseudobdellovibrionaceae bacterium]
MSLLWRLAFRNIFRNQRRTLATVFTVCFGYVGLVLTGGYIIYVEKSIRALSVYINHGGNIVIYKKDGLNHFFSKPKKFVIDAEMLTQMSAVLSRFPDQIERVGSYLTGMGLLSNGLRSTPVLVRGVDPNVDSFVRGHPFVKEYFSDLALSDQSQEFSAFVNRNSEAISITEGLGELLGRRAPFGQLPENQRDVQLAAKSFLGDFNAVNGVLGPRHSTGLPYLEDLSVIMPLKALQNLLLTDGVSSVAIFLKESVSTSTFMEILRKEFLKFGILVDLYPYYGDDVGMFYSGTMGFLFAIGGFFFILILGAVILSVVNTITIGIIERTREIGTLRAIGFKPSDLSELFFKENLVISVICVGLGILFSASIATAINNSGIRFRPTGVAKDVPFMVLPEVWMSVSVAISLIILTCVTAYFVAFRKTKVHLVHLLTDPGG